MIPSDVKGILIKRKTSVTRLHFNTHEFTDLRGHEIHPQEAADNVHVGSGMEIQLLGGEGATNVDIGSSQQCATSRAAMLRLPRSCDRWRSGKAGSWKSWTWTSRTMFRNALAATMRDTLAQMFNVHELTLGQDAITAGGERGKESGRKEEIMSRLTTRIAARCDRRT